MIFEYMFVQLAPMIKRTDAKLYALRLFFIAKLNSNSGSVTASEDEITDNDYY